MPTATKQKKKPFGTSSRNEGVRHNHSTAPTRPGKENIAQKFTSTDPPPRRDSKTPKASNLTTIGGAYGLGDEFLGMNPTRKKKHPKSKQRLLERRDNAAKKKPDPSPLKKPDPTAAAKSTASSSLSRQPKKKSSVRSIVSSALKRSKSDKSKKRDAEFTSTNGVAHPPSNESLSDMDTAGSTPEKNSPLITSPHEKPDPPTRTIEVAIGRKQSQRERVKHDQNVLEQEKKRPAPQFAAINHNQPVGNNNEHSVNTRPSAAPMAPSKKRAGDDAVTIPSAAVAAATLDRSKSKQADNTKVMEAMMNSCKNKSEEHRVVGSVIGGASLGRSHADDMSEMTMIDDNASTTSMTTLGGNNSTIANDKKKKISQLNLQRVDPIVDPDNARQANLIDEETIASHNTSQLKHGTKRQQPVDQGSLSQMGFLPAGWKECISKSKNKAYWKHPDLGTTWHYPGLPAALTGKQQSSQNHPELGKAPELKFPGASSDHRTYDESIAKHSTSHLTSSDFAVEQSAEEEQIPQEKEDVAVEESAEEEQMPQENENDDGSTSSSRPSKQPDPSPLAKPDPTPTHAASNQSQLTSPNRKRISEDYQTLLAPYQSIEKSVASKALSVASSRQSRASFGDDNSSKCLTQEFAVTKDEEQVGVGTPSIGNSVDELDNDNDPVEFDDVINGESYDEDDIMNDRQTADLNSLSSDHVDVDALLTQRKEDSPMSTIRETLNESAIDASPSSAVSSIDYGNVDDMSHKSSARNSDIDEMSQNSDDGDSSQSSQETFSKSAIKDANTFDETLGEDDFDNGEGGQSPMFESHVHDADDSDDEEEISQHQSRRKRSTASAMNLSLDLKRESTGGSSDQRKRQFFPPGPLCSLQFLDEIEDGDFDTPLWRRMKRKRSSLTSVKRGKAAYKANKLRQSH